ncbi:ICMT-domain-containing protein [Patellaria atrata CBS 101060]|uniref:Protein-S-isoprenylcysteine O-methyltransferase n=1 Tax=Patellaria atrata CBS 101060 TaxID=1346257 RepID=A0A9P4S875_9PEZI|nr:ICMT-domain-containing protein [Patellaria atrata CBS 101060]
MVRPPHDKPNGASSPDNTRPTISWPLNRPFSHTSPETTVPPRRSSPIRLPTAPTISRELLHNGQRSLAGISLRAFSLGISLGLSISLTLILLLLSPNPLWRAPLLLAFLSLFHFLEFWTTAAYNTRAATVSSFLLTTNGRAYEAAHVAAFLEILVTSIWFPSAHRVLTRSWLTALGAGLWALGQGTRSLAMAQAGTNFNHTIQTRRSEGHVLVTGGVYAWCRHPSYFGFFWLGVGMQIVLGNTVCLIMNLVVLWSFFNKRIRHEERYLIQFFGQEYVDYKKQTRVWIPFIL